MGTWAVINCGVSGSEAEGAARQLASTCPSVIEPEPTGKLRRIPAISSSAHSSGAALQRVLPVSRLSKLKHKNPIAVLPEGLNFTGTLCPHSGTTQTLQVDYKMPVL